MEHRSTKTHMTQDEVVAELRDLRTTLSRRHALPKIAEIAGVARQTMSQYCMMPESRGHRLIPGAALDRLRAAVALQHYEHWSRAQMPGHPREERQWLVYDANLVVMLDVTFQAFAESYACRHGGVCSPGEATVKRDTLTPDDQLCIDWLHVRHGGDVTKQDAMAVSGTDEWTEGLIGYELPGRRIVPQQTWIDALQSVADERRMSHAA